MDNQQYGKLFSFIWNIANDVLVFAFEKGDYKKIILPFTVLRCFNEENNVTEAGEHFTPRDYVRLLARLAVEPIKNALKDGTYTIYDGASGTGGAGGGESNLRRHIIENDILEAIVAMPEKDFYNTGIGTYIWIVTNRKEARRRGKVQLIDATAISTPLKKNLGEKNCETSAADCDRILKLLRDFRETPESKIFKNEEFGYWEVPVMRPKRDADGNLVLKKGKPVIARARNEVEQIPLTYPGGIAAFYEKEVKPYDNEATFGEPVVGYELSFTKYFYKPVELRTQDEIAAEIAALGKDTAGLLKEILG